MTLITDTTKSEGIPPLDEHERSLRRDRIRALVEPLAAHRGAAAVIMARVMAHTRLVQVGERYCLAVFDNPHGNGAGDLRSDAILDLLGRIYRQHPRLFSVNPIAEQKVKSLKRANAKNERATGPWLTKEARGHGPNPHIDGRAENRGPAKGQVRD
jgi:hypothetical protein